MRLHRFYTNQLVGTKKELEIDSVELSHQMRNVFRLRRDDKVIIFDGSGFDYSCKITDFRKDIIVLDILPSGESADSSAEKSRFMPERDVILYASIVKKDNFEWIAEKATELGVTKIIPVISERSEKKALNMERLKKIVVEASEQSGRGNVPEIGEIETFSESISGVTKLGQQNVEKSGVKNVGESEVKNIVAFHTESQKSAKDYLGSLNRNESVAIFIGPEGGWSLAEIDEFTKQNIDIVSLGGQVLRAETAVISALSLVLLG